MQTPAQCELNKINFFYYISIFEAFVSGFKVLINNTVKPEATARVGVGWGVPLIPLRIFSQHLPYLRNHLVYCAAYIDLRLTTNYLAFPVLCIG